ncbi:IKI3 family-domain-containing protein [Paraphysoderma sedebokerense]|nr:IKI3 family-domain-containing protein [Paraphysoderma sedebokerense]
MKSLTLLTESSVRLLPKSPETQPLQNSSHISVDSANGLAYCLCNSPQESCEKLFKISGIKTSDPEVIELASFPAVADISTPTTAVGIQYLPDNEAVCVAFSNGDIALVRDSADALGDAVDVLGTIDSGILAMAWSPDYELVVFVSAEGKLIEMTKDFDVLAEYPVHTNEIGEDIMVSVGWGKKETQFHGSAGKKAAQEKGPSKVSLSKDDDFKPRISWRGDGNYFCLSSVDPNGEKRSIRIYNREGVLQSTSESVDQLEHSLSWRPEGSLITSTQRLPHKHDVVFFERNGLRHGEFSFRDDLNNSRVMDVFWNSDSSVLAVWVERWTENERFSSIQLWYMNNYHWYLKQDLEFSHGDGHEVKSVFWDPELPLTLHLSNADMRYVRYDFAWDTITSHIRSAAHAAPVLVVDGSQVLYTPLRYSNVPPPMSLHQISSPTRDAIKSVSMSSDINSPHSFAALTSWRGANVHVWDTIIQHGQRIKVQRPTLVGSFALPLCSDSESSEILGAGYYTYRQIQYFTKSSIFAIRHDRRTSSDELIYVEFATPDDTNTSLQITKFESNISPEKLMRLYASSEMNQILVETVDGEIFEVDRNLDFHGKLKLRNSTPWFTSTTVGPADSRQNIIVSMTERSKLFVNDVLISPNATSFFIHDEFLIWTTLQHVVKFWPLKFSLADLPKPSSAAPASSTQTKTDETERRVERGSKIVLAVPGDTILVLQMPRGNLETVHPRALVLATVRRHLDNIDYRSAFILCRKHRIDLNLLHDHNPNQFIQYVEKFVTDLDEVDHLNLFLSGLRPEDVTLSMYRPPVPTSLALGSEIESSNNDKKEIYITRPDKVNIVCDAVRNVLERLDVNRYVQSVITTFVKKSPPDLDSALMRVKELKAISNSLADAALKYTVFLVPVNDMYNVALGLYDFNLVLMVAQHSQKDPREYLPFLTGLKQLPKFYQRFKIDEHLKRHEKAIANLLHAIFDPDVKDEDRSQYWNESLTFINRHGLFRHAVNFVRQNIQAGDALKSSYTKDLFKCWGESLSIDNNFSEAGLVFSMGGDKESALDCYLKSCQWREVFTLTHELGKSESDIARLAVDVSSDLVERRDYLSASFILQTYTHDIELSLPPLLSGSHFAEALRLINSTNRTDLIPTHIVPAVGSAYNQLNETINELREEFDKRYIRLGECRKEKEEKMRREMEMEIDGEGVPDNVDVMSDTTSMMSTFTAMTLKTALTSTSSVRTGKTAKSKRKSVRKRHQGKKGSVYEEEYLIESSRKIINRIILIKDDVTNLIPVLLQFDEFEKGQIIQTTYQNLLEYVKSKLDEIFVPPTLHPHQILAEQYRIIQEGGNPSQMDIEKRLQGAPIEKPVIDTIGWKFSILQ